MWRLDGFGRRMKPTIPFARFFPREKTRACRSMCRSSFASGESTLVSRRSPKGAWHASGQWAYPVDSVAGRDFAHKSRSGVADLLVLDDDSILVLEREMSIRKKAVMPSFRCRLYQVDFAGATDVSTVPSLSRATYRPVTKRRVFGAQTGFAMFEGMCWGPTLTSGTRTILLISDAGSGAVGCIRSFRLVR